VSSSLVALGHSELRVSRLGFGTTGIGMPSVRGDQATVDRMVGAYLDHGGNLFDTADSYNGGWSEAVLGRVLRGRRDEVVLATKVGMPVGPSAVDAGLSRTHVLAAADASLRRLGTDHIDLYQVHLFDHATPLEETLGALDELVRAGKVRALGASSFHAWHLAAAERIATRDGLARFDTLQCKYNLIRRDAEAELLEYCRTIEVSVLAYSPLQGGVLAGAWRRNEEPPVGSRLASPHMRRVFLGDDEERVFTIVDAVSDVAHELACTPGQVALAWLLARDGVAMALIGPESPAELEDGLGALDLTLSDDVRARLDAASAGPLSYPADFYSLQDATFADMRERAASAGRPPMGPQGASR
jgi:aryl-alcohol dehydrogenase-like predicted oxidoreductase